jgi:sec-independent protein translocase protein TatA
MNPVLAVMGSIGWPEMLLILVLVLIFFGPRRLPEIAEAMGKSIRKFKSATQDASREVRREIEDAGNSKREEPRRDEPRREEPRRDDAPRDAGNDRPQGPAQP